MRLLVIQHRKGLEWRLKHLFKPARDKVTLEYDHENLRAIIGQGYRIVNKTENYILLTRGIGFRDQITYNKINHLIEPTL